MTTIQPALNAGITPGTAAGAATAVAPKTPALAADFNMFVKLLITQVQNQDPLSPMDTAQYTQQLVSYSQVEQSISANQKLGAILDRLAGQGLGEAVGLIGHDVHTSGDAVVQNGVANWSLAAGALPGQQWQVLGSGDRVLASGTLAAGDRGITWRAPADAEGRKVTARLLDPASGAVLAAVPAGIVRVTGISREGQALLVQAGEQTIPLDRISRVQ
jgi:flagellar basal-body rod modification protein FlgD